MIAATLIDLYVHCYVFDICNVWTGFLQHPRVFIDPSVQLTVDSANQSSNVTISTF
jgi:hypothetical protein